MGGSSFRMAAYRFAAVENDGFLVRIIIQEYLCAEVSWNY